MEGKITLTLEEPFYVLLTYLPEISFSNSDQPLYKIHIKKPEDARGFAEQISKNLNIPLEKKV